MEKADRKQREDFAMTETKYIFPKQMQSVAALAFIAVLIALLLILIVMVHMRNRKLKSTLEEQIAERRLLDKICVYQNVQNIVKKAHNQKEYLHGDRKKISH